MATITSIANGNWSAPSTWSSVPSDGDSVYILDHVINVDQDINLGITGTIYASGSGYLTCTQARSITADLYSTATHTGGALLRCSHVSGSVDIHGDCYGWNDAVLKSTGNGTVNIYGNCTGSKVSNCHAFGVETTLNVYGDVYGIPSSSKSNSYTIAVSGSSSTVNIYGDVRPYTTGTSTQTATCAAIRTFNSNADVNIYGSIYGTSYTYNHGVVLGGGTLMVSGATYGSTSAGLSYSAIRILLSSNIALNNVHVKNALYAAAPVSGSINHIVYESTIGGIALTAGAASSILHINTIDGPLSSSSGYRIIATAAPNSIFYIGDITGTSSATSYTLEATTATTIYATNVMGGQYGPAIRLAADNTLVIADTITTGVGNAAYAVYTPLVYTNQKVYAKTVVYSNTGIPPTNVPLFIDNTSTNHSIKIPPAIGGPLLQLTENPFDYPAVSDVRSGITYDYGSKVGTCYVPDPCNVAYGVAVGNTFGEAILTTAAVSGAILDATIESPTTLKELIKLFAAAFLGKVSGCESNSPMFRDIHDTKNRITAVTDDHGNRLSIILDAS